MTANPALAAILALAALLGMTRLLLWQHRAAPDARSNKLRLTALLALQPACAALLYLTLAPPHVTTDAGTLVVATRNAPRSAVLGLEERLVVLPEAPSIAGAERSPDLATALRRFGPERLRILGDGLEARDRETARGEAILFDPPPPAAGLVSLSLPSSIAPGAAFSVGGQVGGRSGGSVELLDPAGTRVGAAPLSVTGNFVVRGSARVPGVALFKLRVLDRRRGMTESADIPIQTVSQPPLRMLVLAGAPGPDVKFLRRWATDAGLQLQARISAGGGIDLGDASAPLDSVSLRRTDIVVIDDRSWAGLSGADRRALIDAVRDGLGLLLRVTGPLGDNVRRDWQSLGFTLAADNATAPVPSVLALNQRIVGAQRLDNVPTTLGTANWRAVGRGRVGLWTLTNSFTLVLEGDIGRYGELWSEIVATLARPQMSAMPEVVGSTRAGERVKVCGLAGPAEILSPDGPSAKLLIDPASGPAMCAAFWPSVPGWHVVRSTNARPAFASMPFFVRSAHSLLGIRSKQTREATLRLVGKAGNHNPRFVTRFSRPSSSWPWFLGWLASILTLWWLERTRWGVPRR